MKKLFLLIPILLIGCNMVQDKPCSRQDVKDTILSLFAKNSINYYNNGRWIIYDDVISDSIVDITSNPVNQNTCGCEGNIYYRRLSKIHSNNQTIELKSLRTQSELKYKEFSNQ
ncbi:MAG TPA: hypothetical protein VK808_08185 [Bacteroidia bacterium]|nr:hypothetical protein [Bacteroidia bacterium]